MKRLAGILSLLAMLNSLADPCRLIRAVSPGKVLEYAYDADGNRVSSRVNGTVTNYLVDANRDYAQVIEERDGAGALAASYVYGDDLISQNLAGVVSYYHYDGIGSTRLLTDAAGNTTDTYAYEAFGEVLERTGTTENNYHFTGEQYDPNLGFYYLRARYYDAGTGRFWTADTFEGLDFDPVTLHKYLYAGINPVNRADPSGRFFGSTGEAMAAFAVSASIFVMQHPVLMGTIGFVAAVFLPEEADLALQQCGIPQFQFVSASRSGTRSFFRLLKSSWVRALVAKHASEAGTLWRTVGDDFEKYLRTKFFKGASEPVKTFGRSSIDMLWRGRLIEAKTGIRLDAGDIVQLERGLAYAKRWDVSLLYVFLRKPEASTMRLLEEKGVHYLYFFEN